MELTVEDEVRAVSAAFDVALVRNDASLVATFMTDDQVYVGPTGATPKADIVAWIASGPLVHHTVASWATNAVAWAGDVVLLTAHKVSSGTQDGEPYTADEWISEVYVYTDGTWRCAISDRTAAA